MFICKSKGINSKLKTDEAKISPAFSAFIAFFFRQCCKGSSGYPHQPVGLPARFGIGGCVFIF
jgi:hypothetical protein